LRPVVDLSDHLQVLSGGQDDPKSGANKCVVVDQ
jgi:hypothetical protein